MDKGKYQVDNAGSIQSQNIGDNNTITQHFYGPTNQAGQETSQKPLWRLPYHRNHYFTGRESIINHLHKAFRDTKTAAVPQAITGLSGSGKTQTAVEYAFRNEKDYQYVFLVNAISRSALIAEYVSLAGLLGLAEQQIADQKLIGNAVKLWFLTHTGWLLILDNVTDLEEVQDLIPTAHTGHILITCQNWNTGGFAYDTEMPMLSPEEGALFLLRRAGLLKLQASKEQAPESEYAIAEKLSKMLGGLPLALDQAGAYMQQTRCGLSRYITLYDAQGYELLKQRGALGQDHPDPVATTWSLSFQKIEQTNPAATDLLRLFAFLNPDSIPEKMISDGLFDLNKNELDTSLERLQKLCADQQKWDNALSLIGRFSLIRRDPSTNTLSIHRLVQTVLVMSMEAQNAQSLWAVRVIRIVEHAFPDEVTRSTWPLCHEYRAHAIRSAQLIAEELKKRSRFSPSEEDAAFLSHLGEYLFQRGLYPQAEQPCRLALAIREKRLGQEHPDIVSSLIAVAKLYHAQGNYAKAKDYYQDALTICERTYGPEDLQVASCLHNLAKLHHDEGKHAFAQKLCQRALEIRTKHLEPDDLELAQSLQLLGSLYRVQKANYARVEPLYKRALEIRERHLGLNHPDVAATLTDLAQTYQARVKFTQAEQCLRHAYAIQQETLGREHPDTAKTLSLLAELYRAEGRYSTADIVQQNALQIRRKILGENSPDVARSLYYLARSLHEQHKYADAEPLYRRALQIAEQHFEQGHPDLGLWGGYYGALLKKLGKADAARKVALEANKSESTYQRRNPGYKREPNIVLESDPKRNVFIMAGAAVFVIILDLLTKLLIVHFFPSWPVSVKDQVRPTISDIEDQIDTILFLLNIIVPILILTQKKVRYARQYGRRIFLIALGGNLGAWLVTDHLDSIFFPGQVVRFIPLQLPNGWYAALNIADITYFVSIVLISLLFLFILLELATHHWRNTAALGKIQREIEA